MCLVGFSYKGTEVIQGGSEGLSNKRCGAIAQAAVLTSPLRPQMHLKFIFMYVL